MRGEQSDACDMWYDVRFWFGKLLLGHVRLGTFRVDLLESSRSDWRANKKQVEQRHLVWSPLGLILGISCEVLGLLGSLH